MKRQDITTRYIFLSR